MAFHLDEMSIQRALRHLCKYGDTDIFPHLPELTFFEEQEASIISEIKKLDLDSYTPLSATEALAPKSRYGFRIAHQLPYAETLLFSAATFSIGEQIESKRQGANGARAFSYRFAPDEKGQAFRSDRTYKDWILKQKDLVSNNKTVRVIITTDITDYYARINFHRLENLLDEVAPSNGAARFIKKYIRVIRAKQSFGLPVGGSAARLLAELAMVDMDQALRDKGLKVTRFVDDFRIMLSSKENPYDVLGFLAEGLGINEGLSLNSAKTSLPPRRAFLRRLEDLTSDVSDEAEGIALEALTANLYFDDEPDEDELAQLKGLNLVAILTKEIEDDAWDMGRIRVVFRALKIAKPHEAVEFILERFDKLTIFAKELCLLMEVLAVETPKCFDSLGDLVILSILSPPASSVQLIRTWLIELFVRGVISITVSQLAKIESLGFPLDRRQILLIRGRMGDKNYFRKQKTAVNSFTTFDLPALIWGAACLPPDEYEVWAQSTKSALTAPLGSLFIKWCIDNRTKLNEKLVAKSVDHPE